MWRRWIAWTRWIRYRPAGQGIDGDLPKLRPLGDSVHVRPVDRRLLRSVRIPKSNVRSVKRVAEDGYELFGPTWRHDKDGR